MPSATRFCSPDFCESAITVSQPEARMTKLQLLRSVGLRPTLTRIATLLTMEHAGSEPLCIYEVSRRLPPFGIHASLSTVQRVLIELELRGLLRRQVMEGRSYFSRAGAHAGRADHANANMGNGVFQA